MTPSFKVIFDIDQLSATSGYFIFILEDTSNYSGVPNAQSAVGYFDIQYPDGTTRVGDPNNPDVTYGNSLNSSIPIPKDANGDYMQGTYCFTLHIKVGNNTYTSAAECFEFCKKAPGEAEIDITHDCFCKKLESTDLTDYGTPTTINRSHELYPPPTLGLPPFIVNSSKLVYDLEYTGVYTIQILTELEYTSGIFTIRDSVKTQKVHIVECDMDFCGLIRCLNNYFDRISAQAKKLGGWTYLSAEELSKFFKIIAYKEQFESSLKCGLYDKATEYYNLIKDLLACDCGCPDDEEPKLIDPYCGATSSGSNNVVVSAGTGITVSQSTVGNTTTYTVSSQVTGSSVTFTLTQDTFNSLIQYDSAIELINTSSGNSYVFEIRLRDPEDWKEIVDTDDPPAVYPPEYVAGSILELGKTTNNSLQSTAISHASQRLKVRRDILGYAEFEGGIIVTTSIAASPIFNFMIQVPVTTLPQEFRPAENVYIPLHTTATYGLLEIKSNGDVSYTFRWIDVPVNDVTIYLNGIRFQAEQ